MKYNSFFNPSMSCETDIIIYIIMQAIPTYITMQGLVKEVTLKNHSINGRAILYGNKRSPWEIY